MVSRKDILRIRHGSFAGFSAVVTDVTDSTITVAIEVFGRVTSLQFPIEKAAELLEPFGDVCQQQSIADPETHIAVLRTHHPDAGQIFATHWRGFPVSGSIQLSRSDHQVNLVVRTLNMTAPLSDSNWRTDRKRSQTVVGDDLAQQIADCDFWSLPHDDGRRFSTRQHASHFHLEGWDGSRYHSVTRQTLHSSPIERACRFLGSLAPDAGYAV